MRPATPKTEETERALLLLYFLLKVILDDLEKFRPNMVRHLSFAYPFSNMTPRSYSGQPTVRFRDVTDELADRCALPCPL